MNYLRFLKQNSSTQPLIFAGFNLLPDNKNEFSKEYPIYIEKLTKLDEKIQKAIHKQEINDKNKKLAELQETHKKKPYRSYIIIKK